MISKFSKKRIRLLFGLGVISLLAIGLFQYDHSPYFPDKSNDLLLDVNAYDDQRPMDQHVEKVSIKSQLIEGPFLQIFLRYDPKDNALIENECPDYEPPKSEGLNPKYSMSTNDGNLNINSSSFDKGGFDKMLDCHSSIYQLSINDSIYQNLHYYFFLHPRKKQQGLQTTVPTTNLMEGENVLSVKKVNKSDSIATFENFAIVPFWYSSK